MTPEYIAFKTQVEKQRKVVARKQALADKQRNILKDILVNCPHEEVEQKDSYDSGSYYNKASSTRWMECKLCSEHGPKTTEQLSYYG